MKPELVIYRSKDGDVRLDAQLERETIWLSLNQLATLFGRDKSVVSRHLRNIFKEQELNQRSVVAKHATTAADGKTYQVDYYNLDAIISVGYRVNSKRGTEFRIWATNVLRQHIVQGYTANEKRLKRIWGSNPSPCTVDKATNIYTFTASTPAKPLPRMLNSGGFFFFGGCSQ